MADVVAGGVGGPEIDVGGVGGKSVTSGGRVLLWKNITVDNIDYLRI